MRTALPRTLTRPLPTFTRKMTTQPQTPIQDKIQDKLTTALLPTHLNVRNDSSHHAHHAAMVNNTSPETHFAVEVVSAEFEGKAQPARHRMVYRLLGDELGVGGVHALQIVARTPAEVERRR